MATEQQDGDRFEFRYWLRGPGWATARISDGSAELEPTASYLSDALARLIEAVAVVAEGAPESRCSWDEEPGEFRWVFTRKDDRITLQILWFRQLWGRAPDADGEVVFATTGPLLRVARSVASAAQEVLDELGPDEYERQWISHPFPADELHRLRRAIADERTRQAQRFHPGSVDRVTPP